jgi:urea transport system ATP-binding protein
MSVLTQSLLYLDGVSVAFDGFKAINDLSLTLEKNEMRAIIGPNGAGKTTMMDIITGKTQPDKGQVYFEGQYNLLNLNETQIAERGIGRKFQKPSMFDNLSLYENIALAFKGKKSPLSALFGFRNALKAADIEAILEKVKLLEWRNTLAGTLSHGQKQWLEIGMVLAQSPKLLLVDEPVAGMTENETEKTAELLTELNQNHALIVVEHDMNFVRALQCKVTCLHEGAVLAEGSLDFVSNNQSVIDVYLGR